MICEPRNQGYINLVYNNVLLDRKNVDVNGDGVLDDVSLLGSRNGLAIDDIRIMIHDGKNNIDRTISPKTNKGYEPHLFLGDFNFDNISDILLSIQSGNTGREGYFYIYSFANNILKTLFDYEEFNNRYKYDVTYEDHYIVRVKNIDKGFEYKIDISNRNKEYLSKIYNSDGTLKDKLKGMVSPIIELRPIIIQNDVGYSLNAIQRVIGYYNADTLGMLETKLRWNGNRFDNNIPPRLILFGSDTNIE